MNETEALGDRPQARTLGVVRRRQRGEAPDRPERRGERACVEEVGAAVVEEGDQRAAERGAGDVRGASIDVLDRVRRRQLVGPDEPRDDRVQAGDSEREDRHCERYQDVQGPDARVREARVGREAERHDGQRDLGDEEQPAAVDRVRDRSADDRQGQEREELTEREEPDLKGRVREVVELNRGRNRRDLAAEGRDRLTNEEPAERRVALERADVDGQAPQPSRRSDLGGFH